MSSFIKSRISPYYLAKQISAPVLLIAARDDRVVDYRQSVEMAKALDKNGSDSKLVLLKEGGHSLVTEDARLQMYEAVEKFLRRHLGSDN